MDSDRLLGDFLRARREATTLEEVGLSHVGRRRTPGLRREEVAMLAGVSTDYYTRLERGNLTGVSESVLDALVRALQLDEAEAGHLYDLARTAHATPRAGRRPAAQQVRPAVQRILAAMPEAPAYVRNGRRDGPAAWRS